MPQTENQPDQPPDQTSTDDELIANRVIERGENQPQQPATDDDLLSEDELIDEQGQESFPASDPPAH